MLCLDLVELSVILEFASEQRMGQLFQKCLQLIDGELSKPTPTNDSQKQQRARDWIAILPVLYRLGLGEQAGSAAIKVTDASADEISSLKSKVDDSFLNGIYLAKMKKLEQENGEVLFRLMNYEDNRYLGRGSRR